MLKKTVIALIILLLTAGIAFAVDIGDIKAPEGFQKDLGVILTKDNYEISILKLGDIDSSFLFDEDDDYKVSEYENNTYNFTDKLLEHAGVFEVVEINGEKYYIECFQRNATSYDDSAYDCLFEFNSLNNLTAIKP